MCYRYGLAYFDRYSNILPKTKCSLFGLKYIYIVWERKRKKEKDRERELNITKQRQNLWWKHQNEYECIYDEKKTNVERQTSHIVGPVVTISKE